MTHFGRMTKKIEKASLRMTIFQIICPLKDEPQIIVIEDHPDISTVNDREGVELTSPLEETDSPHDDQLETVYGKFGDETHRRSLH